MGRPEKGKKGENIEKACKEESFRGPIRQESERKSERIQNLKEKEIRGGG